MIAIDEFIFLTSIGLRVAGLGYSVWLLYRVKDARFGFLTLMLGLMATRQVFSYQAGAPAIEELPGLLVSVLAVLTVYYLSEYVEQEAAIKATIQSTNERLRTFEKAIEHAGHAIFITEPDATITYANRAVESLTGYTRGEVLGRDPSMWKSSYHDEQFYEDMWETIESGSIWEGQVVNERKDGTQIWVDMTIAPIVSEDGIVEKYVAVDTDVTERRKRKERLKAEKERVEQLHQRLSVMNRILRHDIRSSVNIIKGNAQLADSSDSHLDEALETVIDEADRLLRMAESARHIEALADSDSGVTTIDVATMLRTKVHRFKNDYPEAEFEVEIPDSVTILAHDRFDLALEHLLSNAIVHHDRDSPTVEVSVTQSRTDGTVEIGVADDGPGIPDAEIRPLGEGRETPLEHMSGVGLWLTQWIVEHSNGQLHFEENEPRGTVVRIELEPPD